jgi:tetratricopeptide (TPR) repeat protein
MERQRINRIRTHVIGDDAEVNIDVYEKINEQELIGDVNVEFLVAYYNAIKIKRNYNLFNEDDFLKFKGKVINAFKNNDLFPQRDINTLQTLYINKIEPCEDIKKLCKVMLNLYTLGGNYKRELLLYFVINSNLKYFREENINKMKHVLISILLNFNKEFNSNIQNLKKVYRLTNFNEGILEPEKLFYCNQFMSTSIIDTLSTTNDFFKSRNTCLQIELNFNEELDFFSNYIDISDQSAYKEEREVLICPFTKFEVLSIEQMEDKQVVQLKVINDNLFICSIFSNLFKISNSNINSHYEKLMKFYEVSLERALNSDNKEDANNLYNNIGNLYYLLADYKKALEFFEKSLNLKIEVYGPDYKENGGCYNNIGLVLTELCNYEKAIENFNLSLKILENYRDSKETTIAKIYNNMGYICYRQSKFQEAREFYNKDIEIISKIHGENHLSLSDSYNNIGLSYYDEKNFDLAEENYKKALKICLNLQLENHISTAGCYNNMGLLYNQKRNFEKALECYKKSVKIRIYNFGDKTKDIAHSYNNIGLVYINQGNYSKAMEYFEKCLGILGENHIDNATFLDNLGRVNLILGNLKKAKEYYQKALNLKINLIGEESSYFPVNAYNNIGEVCIKLGELDNALEFFNKSVEISNRILGSECVEVANIYFNIGVICLNKKNYIKGCEYFQKSLEIKIKKSGEFHQEISDVYNNLGIILIETGKFDEALEMFNKSLKCEGNDNFAVFKYLGDLYVKKNDNTNALKNFRTAVEILEKTEDNKTALPIIYNSIATIQCDEQNYYEAIDSLEKAKTVYIEIHGEKHIKIAEIYKSISLTYEKLGILSDAINNFENYLNIKIDLLGEKNNEIIEERKYFSNLKKKKKKNACGCNCSIF